tara:strand:- start:347 stop:559 length:213 start_codon:yes stop_codon:yes gene_type:complete
MLKFKELKANLQEASNIVKKVKIDRKNVVIQKLAYNKFKTLIDGDELDTYPNEKEAMAMAKEFIKQYKGR